MCEPLMPDVVAPKAHQNNCSYVNSADLPSDLLCKNVAWWAVTWRTSKKHKTVKIRGGRGGGACQGQYSTQYMSILGNVDQCIATTNKCLPQLSGHVAAALKWLALAWSQFVTCNLESMHGCFTHFFHLELNFSRQHSLSRKCVKQPCIDLSYIIDYKLQEKRAAMHK